MPALRALGLMSVVGLMALTIATMETGHAFAAEPVVAANGLGIRASSSDCKSLGAGPSTDSSRSTPRMPANNWPSPESTAAGSSADPTRTVRMRSRPAGVIEVSPEGLVAATL